MTAKLWVEKYRPTTLDDYVWRDLTMREKFEEFLSHGALPHLLLSGKSGLGKTSLAKLMLKLLGIPDGDILTIYASRERKIDEIQERIMNFVKTYPMIDNPTGMKYVLLDEADAMSQQSQKFLRSEMENFTDTTRFILTCNYPQKIMPAILSRCQQFHFEALKQEDFVVRLQAILVEENINFEVNDLVDFIDGTYPDLRKCINLIEQSCVNGNLRPLNKEDSNVHDYMFEAIELFKARQHSTARKMIVSQASVEEYPEIFRFLYNNLDLWSEEQDTQDDALIIIRDGMYKHNFCADSEINLSATIAELVRLGRK